MTTSYANLGGTGDRSSIITVTTSSGLFTGDVAQMVDGAWPGTLEWVAGKTDGWIQFDFGAPKIVDEFMLWQKGSVSHGTWHVAGSDDALTWTQLGEHFLLQGASFYNGAGSRAGRSYPLTNAMAYRYYRLVQESGATQDYILEEIDFKIADEPSSSDSESGVTSYSNPGGSGDRRDLIALALLAGLYTSPTNQLPLAIIDGTKAGNDNAAWSFVNGSSGNGLIFDFGPTGYKQIVDEFTWYQNNSTNHGTWSFEGSDDLSSWTTLATGFNLVTASTSVHAFTNTTAFRYYRLIQLTGTASNSPWCEEIEFKIAPGAPILEPVNVWQTGDRRSRITVTTTGTKAAGGSVGNVDAMLDGDTTSTTGPFSFASGQSGVVIDFDFGTPTIVSAARMHANTTSANSGTWQWQASDDASTWDDLGPDFMMRLNGSSSFPLLNWPWLGLNRTAYRYYRLAQTSGTTASTIVLKEIEFFEDGEESSESASELPSEPPSSAASEPVSSAASELASSVSSSAASSSDVPSEPPSEDTTPPVIQCVVIGFGF
jgi:hypothetical protein